ncbi:MAG: phytanoyl-CoA dioxygenase family protein [Bacteroidota bacterium]
MKSILTQSQRKFYAENGYLVLENQVSVRDCASMVQQAERLVENLKTEWDHSIFTTQEQERQSNQYFLDSGGKIRVFMEEGVASTQGDTHRVNKLGHALHDLDPIFRKFSYQARWHQIAQEIGLQQAGLLQSMYIFKQPRIGGEVNIHQDATFLYTEPISVMGFWFAMQDATLENGCLWALPGGHRLGLKQRFVRGGWAVQMKTLDTTPLPGEGYVPLEVPAGSLVLLHGLLPHYSEANHSAVPRQAYALHVIDQESEYPADNWLQRGEQMPIKGFMDNRKNP